jgi:hypothetical protein
MKGLTIVKWKWIDQINIEIAVIIDSTSIETQHSTVKWKLSNLMAYSQ